MAFISTPWGVPDSVTEIADGITHFTTPSHGGYHVSDELFAEMPAYLKACSFSADQWFEEDCSWCAVVLAFPLHFDTDQVVHAQQLFNLVYSERPQIIALTAQLWEAA